MTWLVVINFIIILYNNVHIRVKQIYNKIKFSYRGKVKNKGLLYHMYVFWV